jgi:hypothetical protein
LNEQHDQLRAMQTFTLITIILVASFIPRIPFDSPQKSQGQYMYFWRAAYTDQRIPKRAGRNRVVGTIPPTASGPPRRNKKRPGNTCAAGPQGREDRFPPVWVAGLILGASAAESVIAVTG